jgi:DNA-binding beta-propeller fold protein YncE
MKQSRFTTALQAMTAAIVIAAGTLTGAHAEEASKVVTVIDGFQSPESVLIVGDRRFVSNIGRALDPVAKDGDGYISEVSAEGRIVAQRAFPPAGETLDAPKGMAAVDGRLYVADIDRVMGFDLASGARVFEQRLPGDQPALANDLVATGDGQLLLTDTLRNSVYRLDPKSGAFTEVASGIPGANGIAADPRNGRILVVGLGENFSGGDVFTLDVADKPSRLEKSPHGLFDGLAVLPDGRLLVSDWNVIDLNHPVAGSLYILSAAGTVISEVQIGREIRGPADFAFDAANSTLWIPATIDNQVVVVRLSP